MFGWLFFLLGLIIGSFLNVVIYRLNEDKRSLRGLILGRSFCPRCRKTILWHDNIPLLSFFLLRGRCRFCHAPISWQYPLVELATGILFLIVACCVVPVTSYGWLITGYWLLMTSSLLVILVSDLHYQTIPDEIVYPAMVATVFFHLRSLPQVPSHLGGVLLAGLAAAAFFYLLLWVTRGKGMGMGDVKLAGLMGLILGYPRIVVSLFIAFLTGAIAGVILILLGKKHFGEHIPFGPFLVIATVIGWLWGLPLWHWYWLHLFG